MSRTVQEQLAAMKGNPSFTHPPGLRQKQSSKYNKRDNWKNVKEIIHNKSFFDQFSVKLEGNEALWEKSVDMGKILEESWNIESSDFMEMKINAANDFFAPTRQVESLERTTVELNNINMRVEKDIASYEAAQNHDDVFQLLDEDDDIHFTTGFDRKSIMEESKQKVNVMLEVDYKKQQAKKEGVLNDLKGWFDEMKNDNFAEFDIDAEEPGKRFSDEPVNALLASAHAAKDRLLDIHTEIIEHFVQMTKNMPQKEGEIDKSSFERTSKELEEATSRLREAEGRVYSLEKLLDKKEEELKFYRMNDNSKTSQLKEELFSSQQQSQDRETELIREISRLKQQLEKAQHQLDAWNAEVSASSHSLDFENMDIDDIKESYIKSEASKKQLEAQIKLLKEEAAASEFIKSKEIQLIKAQKDEEINKKTSKAKQEARDEVNVIKAEYSMELQQMQQSFTDMMNSQIKKLTETITDKDSKKMLDVLRKAYEDRLQVYKDAATAEQQRLRDENANKEKDLQKDWQQKQHLMVQTHKAELEKMKAEGESRSRTEVASLRQQMESKQVTDQLVSLTSSNNLRKTLGMEMKEIQLQLSKKEQMIKEMASKLDFLNELVVRDMKGEKEDIFGIIESEKGEKVLKPQGSFVASLGAEGKLQAKDLEQLRAEFLIEKKKAIELASQKWKLEKETALNAIHSKYEYELANIAQAERARVLKEQAEEIERIKQSVAMEMETKMQFLQDEIQIMRQQLGNERVQREFNGDNKQRMLKDVSSYERTVQTLQERHLHDVRYYETKMESLQKEKEEISLIYNQKIQDLEKELENQKEEIQSLKNYRSSLELLSKEVEQEVKMKPSTIPPNTTTNITSVSTDSPRTLQRQSELLSISEQRRMELQKQKEILEDKLIRINTENERLKQAKAESVLGLNDMDVKLKAEAAESAFKLNQELEEKSEHLKFRLQSVLQALSAEEIKNKAMQDMLISMNEIQSTEKDKQLVDYSEEKIRKMNEAVQAERSVLKKQIEDLEISLKTQAEDSANAIKLASEEEERKSEEQRTKLQQLVDTYENRIKGLTSALTQMLSDTEIAEELQKSNNDSAITSQMLYQLEMERIRENMKRLEENHKISLAAIQAADRNEIKRLQNTIERLKQEFTVLLEEEKLGLSENEQKSADLLEMLEKELDAGKRQLKSEGTNNEVLESGIDAISHLYQVFNIIAKITTKKAMTMVVKNRRDVSNKFLKDKLKAVGTLQQEMLAKSKALLEAKEKWAAEQKRLEASLENTQPSARDRTIADLKAKLLQQDKIIDGIKAQKESVAMKLSLAYVPIEEHKRAIKELEKIVEDLKTRLSLYQKQLQNQETTLSAVKAQIGSSVANRYPFPSMKPMSAFNIQSLVPLPKQFQTPQQPIPGRVSPQNINSQSQPITQQPVTQQSPFQSQFQTQTQVPSPITLPSSSSPIITQPQQTIQFVQGIQQPIPQHPPSTPQIKKDIPSTLLNLSYYKPILKALPSMHATIQQQSKIVDKVWQDVEKISVSNEQDKQRREVARTLISRDRHLQEDKVVATYAKMTEGLKLKKIGEEIEHQGSDEKVTKALSKMAERHQKTVAKWEARREAIVEEQRNNWLYVLKAVTDVVEQKPSSAPESAADSFKIQTYADYVKQKLENGQLSDLFNPDYFMQKQPSDSGESHTLNFRRYVPFSTAHKKSNQNMLLAKGNAPIKDLLDTSWESENAQLGVPYPSSQIILDDWPGIEGRPAQMFPLEEKYKGRNISPTRERPERDIPQQLPPLQEQQKPIENPLQIKKLPSRPVSPQTSSKQKDTLPPIQRPTSK